MDRWRIYGRGHRLKKGQNDTPQYVTAYMQEMKKKTSEQTNQMKTDTIEYLKVFANLYKVAMCF